MILLSEEYNNQRKNMDMQNLEQILDPTMSIKTEVLEDDRDKPQTSHQQQQPDQNNREQEKSCGKDKCRSTRLEVCVLQKMLMEKEATIRKLHEEIGKRDRILEFYGKQKPSRSQLQRSEVILTHSSEGHPIYEIMNREQIPFMVKIEQLDSVDTDSNVAPTTQSPIVTESPAEELNFNNLQEEEEEQDRWSLGPVIKDYRHGKDLRRNTKERDIASSSLRRRKRSRSHGSYAASGGSRHSSRSRASKQRRIHSSSSSQQYDRHRLSSESGSHSQSQSSNVFNIPEIYRLNFGCSELQDLADCPIALKFWFDERHKDMIKIFIRLHCDDGLHWEDTKLFVVKEQQRLALPKTQLLTFHQLRKHLYKTSDKRIWVDIRDFSFFSRVISPFFKIIGRAVTHFSFGRRLYSKDEVRANTLLDFIFEYLPNLEFCSINDGMLQCLDKGRGPLKYTSIPIPQGQLRTLRLIHSKQQFTTDFVLNVLKNNVKLENLYGIPLHSLKHLDNFLDEEFGDQNSKPMLLRSMFVNQSLYEDAGEDFQDELWESMKLRRIKMALEELDLRTFFLGKNTKKLGVRQICSKIMLRLVEHNERTLTKLIMEPLTSHSEVGNFPRLSKVKSIRFDLSKNAFDRISQFFPVTFDVQDNFPGLKSVELYLDPSSGRNIPAICVNLFEKHFPSKIYAKEGTGEVFKNVQSLHLIRFTPTGGIRGLARYFQNLRVLRLNNTLDQVSKALPRCFEYFPQLQQLILEIDSDAREGNLDEAITGIPRDKCKILEKAAQDPPPEEQIQKWITLHRTEYSICHLPALRLLKIIIRPEITVADGEDFPAVLTPVSALYGFATRVMSKLGVYLAFDERTTSSEKEAIITGLTPILPYVTLEL